MAIDFSAFDKKVDFDKLKADMEELKKNGSAKYPKVPAGRYTCELEKLSIGETKDGRPMLKAMMRIKGGADGEKCKYNKQCIFLNRVLYGTKNDANMIASAEGWLKTLEPSEDVGDIVFEGYAQFNDLVLDIAEDIIGNVEYVVDYDDDVFNSIDIVEAMDK